MKKILVLAAALALVLCAAAACAEERTYISTGIMDADGNIAELNEQIDKMTISFDDEAMTCSFSVNDTSAEGTFEVTEQTDTAMTIVATFPEEDDPVTFTYDLKQDMFMLHEETYDITLVFTESEETGDDTELHDRGWFKK